MPKASTGWHIRKTSRINQPNIMDKPSKSPTPKALKKPTQGPETKEALKGLRITVNEFGEIVRDYNIDDINKFLDENVPDKKFTE